MLNSVEHLIDILPEPIRKVIMAAQERTYESEYDRGLYFALLDLHKWLDEPTYGESIFKNIMKAFFINEKFEIIKKHVNAYHAMTAGLKRWREEHSLYGRPQVESKKIPKAPIPDHIKRENFPYDENS